MSAADEIDIAEGSEKKLRTQLLAALIAFLAANERAPAAEGFAAIEASMLEALWIMARKTGVSPQSFGDSVGRAAAYIAQRRQEAEASASPRPH